MIAELKRTKAGFTLVELIVVISILGILAGISMPVYTGYIARAGEAADMQLLGAVNTAFAATCADLGRDPTQVNATAALADDGRGAKTLQSVTVPGLSAFNDTFFRYFGDNAATGLRCSKAWYITLRMAFSLARTGNCAMTRNPARIRSRTARAIR